VGYTKGYLDARSGAAVNSDGKPIDINELNAKLSKSLDHAQRMALKRNLSLMGCL
jgi:hypothetical protein